MSRHGGTGAAARIANQPWESPAVRVPKQPSDPTTPRDRFGGCALRSVALAAGLGAAVIASADDTALPPLSGALSGRLPTYGVPGAPELRWTLTFAPGPAAESRRAGLHIEGVGALARGDMLLDRWLAGTWRLAEARLDVGPWYAAFAGKLGAPWFGYSAAGAVALSGEGTLHDGTIGGRMRFDWTEGALRDNTAGWAIEGLNLGGTLGALPQLTTEGVARLTFREANSSGIVAREGSVEFSIDAERRVHVRRAAMGLMEGRVEFSPFIFDPAKPEVRTNATFDSVELKHFAAFLPAALSEARGPVSGRMQISWTQEQGLKSASGTLSPDRKTPASIRLSASPGFLTSRLPEKMREHIDLLPAWMGPIRGLFRPRNPAYDTLRAIEMGDAPLELETLELTVNPEGDAQGRTARVVLMTRPAAATARVVESVRFEINITGPLADLVKLGLEGRVKVRAR